MLQMERPEAQSVLEKWLRIVLFAAFQQLDVDYYLGPPDPKVQTTELTEVPILRMYGVSEAGS